MRIIIHLSFIFFVFLGTTYTTIAQNFDSQKLNNYFDTLYKYDKFLGSVAVLQNGKFVFKKSVGFCDKASNNFATEESRYRIGSITKTFTAVLAFQAIQEYKLLLEQNIASFFPRIQNADKITIEHLLYHRSGIHNFTNDSLYLSYYTEEKSKEEMLAIIREAGIDFEPGSQFAYSNSNYVLLSYILEKVLGDTYPNLLQNRIIKPLDLKDTYFGRGIDLAKNECMSYRFISDWNLENITHTSIPLGAGAIVSTPSDLTIFIRKLFAGELISSNSLAKMKKIKDGFGMGLFSFPFYEHKGYGHTGGIDGFSSVLVYFEDLDLAYALCSNGSNYNNNSVSIAVLSAMLDKSYIIPSFNSKVLAKEEMQQYVGLYTSDAFPMTITISIKDEALIGQASGQAPFPLEYLGENKFKFEMAGLELLFFPNENKMRLNQGGGEYNFIKK